ncbi:methyl-accepting chemotaxis protein [Sphingobium lactosutens]|uniref:methyl-accepting chemotaxis protein n=1 Tax=Sphingobium lactosutens TaxID=522773 RepID=UPI0021177E62|nr:methyl-accepting chemotaxis protein [Sphingobium lactosutens]NWK98887.1 methyl-accepting chemotaxis protein [Sphingobium lactosutens]
MLAFLDSWRLPRKLLAAFTIIGLLLGFVAYDDYSSTNTMSAIAKDQSEKGFAGMSELTDMISNVKELRILVYSFYNVASAKEEVSLNQRLEKASDGLNTALRNFKALGLTELDGDVQTLEQRITALIDVNEEIYAKRTSGDLPGTMALLKGDGRVRSHATIQQTNLLIKKMRKNSDKIAADAAAKAGFALKFTIALGAIGIAVIIGIWLMIDRSVTRPLGRITAVTTTLAEGGKADVPYRERKDEIGEIAGALDHFRAAAEARSEADARAAAEQRVVTTSLRDSLSAMTEGDLSRSITTEFPSAYGELKTNFNAALGSLRELIGAVAESAVAIRTGSGEIAQASEDLARRTESNAASLEETSAAITQMDDRLRATAAAAGRTVQRADGAMAVVDSGRSVADEAVQAMGRVSESAKGIDSVIEGLDKIAFQTRVLAMNAAVEAGRAGDAGRGFAVVADLVSALAMRSEEEAKRAREQLTATQTDIGTAVEAVQKVDGALQNISADVSQVHTLLSEIATDNQAQSSTITQISAAIGTMDQATQQNAAMVEETSAAARNLSSEVTALADRASMFSIGDTPGRTSAPAARTAPVSFAPSAASSPKPLSARATADDWLDF